MKITGSFRFRHSISIFLCLLFLITIIAPVATEADDKPGAGKSTAKGRDKDEMLRKKELDSVVFKADQILQDIIKAGERIKTVQKNGSSCKDMKCPTQDCNQASQLRQSLLEADTALDEMYRRLLVAEASAAQNYNNLQANNHLTGTIYRQVQDSLALQKYLHKIGTLMIKLSNIKETLEKMINGGYSSNDKIIEKLDSLANSLKNTLDVLDETTVALGAESSADSGLNPETVEAVKHIWNLKNGLKDTITAVLNASKAADKKDISHMDVKNKVKILKERDKALVDVRHGSLKLLSKALIAWSEYEIKTSQKILNEMKNYDNAEVLALVKAYNSWQKIRARREAAEEALSAVRAAREGHDSCLSKTKCGNTSAYRPQLPAAKGYSDEAMNALDKLLVSSSTSLEKTGGKVAIKDDCSAPGKDWKSSVPSKHAVKAKCPSCDWRAKELERLLDERQFCVEERRRIEADLEKADELEKEAELEREAIQQFTQFILDIRDIKGNILEKFMARFANFARRNKYFRIDFEPGTEITMEEIERQKNSLLLNLRATERQIEFLRQDKGKVKPLWDELAKLDKEVDGKKYLLEVCEKHDCKNRETTGQKPTQPAKPAEAAPKPAPAAPAPQKAAPMPRKGGLVGGVESVGDAIRGK